MEELARDRAGEETGVAAGGALDPGVAAEVWAGPRCRMELLPVSACSSSKSSTSPCVLLA